MNDRHIHPTMNAAQVDQVSNLVFRHEPLATRAALVSVKHLAFDPAFDCVPALTANFHRATDWNQAAWFLTTDTLDQTDDLGDDQILPVAIADL